MQAGLPNLTMMLLLFTYVFIALGFSFLCSITEAVILSVTPAYVALLEEEGKPSGAVLRRLKTDVSQPLAAILTLNTIAHTMGAAGAGAQAAVLFGSASLGVASALLTLLILIFSEIIPKTLGAHYWRRLAPLTAHVLKVLVRLLYPFVKLSEFLTGHLTEGPTLSGFSRREFAAMADISEKEGQLAASESMVLRNLLELRVTRAREVMTPRPVVFSVPGDMTVESFFQQHEQQPFSRIPIYADEPDAVTGFVLRNDLLLAQTRGQQKDRLRKFQRAMVSLPEGITLARAFNELQRTRAHMALVVDEYGDMQGILTLEDVIETLLGMEIVDESDLNVDMRTLARRKWRRRARKMGIKLEGDS